MGRICSFVLRSVRSFMTFVVISRKIRDVLCSASVPNFPINFEEVKVKVQGQLKTAILNIFHL